VRATRARRALLVFLLTLALLPFSCAGRPAQRLPIGMTAVAYGDTTARRSASTATTATLAMVDSAWDATDWRGWEGQVREVKAPADITAGQPLRVEVRALDPNGHLMSNARVEITWILPDRQYRDTGTTGPFGKLSSTRTLGASCCRKLCVIAVTVTGDSGAAYAFSAFEPK
jgi:hypothetical protein